MSGGSNPPIAPIPSCSDNKPTGSSSNGINFAFWTCSTPKVTSVNPRNGTGQTQITIIGRGFSSTNNENDVSFGDLQCAVTFSNNTVIICNLLKTAEPDPGLLHGLSLSVYNRGNALIEIMSESDKSFGVIPNIEQVNPSTGSQAGGARVTVTGFGFGNNSQVSVDGVTCNVLDRSYTQLVFETPSFLSNTDKEVVVTNFVGELPLTAKCESTQSKKCNYTYSSLYTPRVDSISPTTTSGNTRITISGSNFGTSSADIEVTVGGETATNLDVTANSIEADISNIPAGSNEVVVKVKDKGRAQGSFTVTGSATISGISPSSGSTFGGTNITIQGNGFVENKTTIKVGGLDCDIISITLFEVACTTKPHAADDVSVAVTSNGVSYSSAQFSYSAGSTPSVTSVSPSTGLPGETLTISGINLDGDAVFVTLDSVDCAVLTKSNTQITCTLGNHATGKVSVTVRVKGKGLSNTDKEFVYTLAILSISPNEGLYIYTNYILKMKLKCSIIF